MNCSGDFCLDYGWHTICLGFLMNRKIAILSTPEEVLKSYQPPPKPLTRGAVLMICGLLAFILLAVAGTAVTISEYFLNSSARKAKPEKYKGFSTKSSKEVSKKCSENSDAWLNRFKSFIGCFCILKNGRKLLSLSSNKDKFECISGIRFLSNFWTVTSHAFLGNMLSLRNMEDLKPILGKWYFQPFLNGEFIVDAFFVLSGFLNAHLFFKNYDKNNGNVSWSYFYIKRFVRLTPVYMVVLGFYTFLFPYMGSGPIWLTFNTNPVCSQSWWWNLLYINNFRNYTSQCMEWCWYLAADMQFYIISPIFLVSLMRHPRLGYVLTGACIAASCLANFIITKQYNLLGGLSRMEYYLDDFDRFVDRFITHNDLIYTKPYTRISSYLVPILLAHHLYTRKLKIKCSQGALLLGWISTIVLWLFAYFALFKREENIIEDAVHNGLKRLFYSIGLSWIIFTCLIGQAGFINKFLSWKIFSPLEKLSYCTYLIHPLLLMKYYQTTESLGDLNVSSVLLLLGYVHFWTYIFSFIASLLFEFPFLNMLDLISPRKRTARLECNSSKKGF